MRRLIGDEYDLGDTCAGCIRAIEEITRVWGDDIANDTPINGADFLESVVEILQRYTPFALPDPSPSEEEDNG